MSVCTDTDFSAVEKDKWRETLHACSTTIQDELLPFWWTLAYGRLGYLVYFRDIQIAPGKKFRGQARWADVIGRCMVRFPSCWQTCLPARGYFLSECRRQRANTNDAAPTPSVVSWKLQKEWGSTGDFPMGDCLRPTLRVPFSSLTSLVGWLEGHLACKKLVAIISQGSPLWDTATPGATAKKKAKNNSVISLMSMTQNLQSLQKCTCYMRVCISAQIWDHTTLEGTVFSLRVQECQKECTSTTLSAFHHVMLNDRRLWEQIFSHRCIAGLKMNHLTATDHTDSTPTSCKHNMLQWHIQGFIGFGQISLVPSITGCEVAPALC